MQFNQSTNVFYYGTLPAHHKKGLDPDLAVLHSYV